MNKRSVAGLSLKSFNLLLLTLFLSVLSVLVYKTYSTSADSGVSGTDGTGSNGLYGNPCHAPNAYTELCGKAGANGGGTSWMLMEREEAMAKLTGTGVGNMAHKIEPNACPKKYPWIIAHVNRAVIWEGNANARRVGVVPYNESRAFSGTIQKWAYNSSGYSRLPYSNDAQALHSSIMELIKDKSKMLTNGNGGRGYVLQDFFVKGLFEIVQQVEPPTAKIQQYSLTPANGKNTNTAYFCFDPALLQSESTMDTRSYVKVTGSRPTHNFEGYSRLNSEIKPKADIDLKEGESVTVTMKHYAVIDIGEHKVNNFKFKETGNDFHIRMASKQTPLPSGNIQNDLVDALVIGTDDSTTLDYSGWTDSQATDNEAYSAINPKYKRKVKLLNKEISKTFSYNSISGDNLRFCSYTALDVQAGQWDEKDNSLIANNIVMNTNSVPKGTPGYKDNPGTFKYSQSCITIRKAKIITPLYKPEDSFCEGVNDEHQDYGNTAAVSAVLNVTKAISLSKGQYFPNTYGTEPNDDTGKESATLRAVYSSETKRRQNETRFLLAKPFDNIQFQHVLCYGQYAVESSEYSQMPGQERSRVARKPTKFNISSNPDRHLFGDSFISHSSVDINIDGMGRLDPGSIQNYIIDKSRAKEKDKEGNKLTGLGLRIESPSMNTYKYNDCLEPDGKSLGNQAQGYTIPGKQDNCGNNSPTNQNKAGKTFSQTHKFEHHQVWVGKKNKEIYANKWECDCGSSYNDESNVHSFRNETDYHNVASTSYIWEGPCNTSGECCTKWCEDCYTDSDGNEHCDQYCCGSWVTNYVPSGHTERFYPANEQVRAEKFGTVGVKVPYNFKLKYTEPEKVFLPNRNSEIVYPGETIAPPEIKVQVVRRKNPDVDEKESYATITPNIRSKLIAFTVDKGVPYGGIALNGGQHPNEDVCKFFSGTKRCSAEETTTANQKLNPEGHYDGGEPTQINSTNITVPDEEVGTKFCVAMATWPSDSHGKPEEELRVGEDQSPALTENIDGRGKWLVSKPTCRSIAKKPTTQVLGGSINTTGASAAITAKDIGTGIKFGPNNNQRFFGSFTDQAIFVDSAERYSAIGTLINGLGSGASFGYNDSAVGKTKSPLNIFNLAGGHNLDPTAYFCKEQSPLTFGNRRCNNLGFLNVQDTGDPYTYIHLVDRYTGREEKVVPTATLDRTFADHCENSTYTKYSKYMPNRHTACVDGAKYTKLTNEATINGLTLQKKQANDKYSNNTYIIDAKDQDINIDGNICYDSCDNNNTVYNGANEVPQLLIFARNIKINSRVTRIDAWLITNNDINTCSEFDKENIQAGEVEDNAQVCAKQLTINGPVLSNEGTIRLNRTAGAYPGGGNNPSRITGWPRKPNFVLNEDGSITPAEIFHYRQDAYLWAFSQARRLTHVNVTHRRELPVRY